MRVNMVQNNGIAYRGKIVQTPAIKKAVAYAKKSANVEEKLNFFRALQSMHDNFGVKSYTLNKKDNVLETVVEYNVNKVYNNPIKTAQQMVKGDIGHDAANSVIGYAKDTYRPFYCRQFDVEIPFEKSVNLPKGIEKSASEYSKAIDDLLQRNASRYMF